MEKMPENIINLNVYHKWHAYKYGSWDIERDRQNVCHFGPLIKVLKKIKKTWRYYHVTQVCHKWQSYDVWFLRYEVWQTEFLVILDCFLSFYPINNSKNQNFEKLKKTHGDIIILHKCTKNHDHMLYCSSDMACNRCNCYFSFWATFCPFTSLTAQKL